MSVRDQIATAATDAAIASTATKWGMGGGLATSVFGWMSSNGAAVLVGIVMTVAGFFVNYVYQRKRFKLMALAREEESVLAMAEEARRNAAERRAEELHEAQLLALKEGREL